MLQDNSFSYNNLTEPNTLRLTLGLGLGLGLGVGLGLEEGFFFVITQRLFSFYQTRKIRMIAPG